jgi:glyoxylase-like metal-dependent hydrolase (beta-lactamase superfamily II)
MALSARVVRLTAPNPGVMTGPGTNSYLVGTTELAVVDPGPDPAAEGGAGQFGTGHVEALAAAGRGRIRWIVVTHTHPDHSPGAAALRALTGAEVIGFDSRDGFVADRAVADGFELAGEGFTLRAVHTPGHASNHLCWLLNEEGLLFSGDHVMGGSTVVIAPPDGDMAVYLESLRRLLVLDPPLHAIAPGHGPLLTDPRRTVEAVIAHRLRREEAVAEALVRARTATVAELLPTVYPDVSDELRPVAAKSLWAHLRKLATDGRAETTDPDQEAADWTAV